MKKIAIIIRRRDRLEAAMLELIKGGLVVALATMTASALLLLPETVNRALLFFHDLVS